MQMLHEHGIATWGSFVFGFDTDNPEVFDRTVEAGIEMKLTMALFAILTPYPGTALYRRLLGEGRLTDAKWWMRHDHDAGSPYYIPKKMTREQLREGWVRAWTTFYSYSSIMRRFTVKRPTADTPGSSWLQTLGYWPLNFMQHQLAHRKIAGGQQRFRAGVELENAAASFAPGPVVSPSPVGFAEIQTPSLAAFTRRKSDGRKALNVL
jgi:hypothetical protein